MKKNNLPLLPLPGSRLPQTALSLVLLSGLGLSLLPVQNPSAQVRVYDAGSGQSLPVGAAASQPQNEDDETTSTTPTPASSIGGIRTESRPVQGSQNDKNATPAISASPATEDDGEVTSAKPLTEGDKALHNAIDRIVTDALGNPIPTSAQKSSTTPVSLGQVFVFMNVSEFSPITTKRLQELSRIEDITPIYYMDERRPQEYMALLGKDFFEAAGKIKFKVDGGGNLAEAYGVKDGNTIVYRLPNGSIRRYRLNTEIGVFLEQLNRIRNGEST